MCKCVTLLLVSLAWVLIIVIICFSCIKGAWRGGSLLASSPDFESMCVTKSEYEELGSYRCRRRFFH